MSSWYFDYQEGSFGFGFRNFSRSLNNRRMSLAQIITTEWTAEKCSEKRQINAPTQARQPNKQIVKSAGRRSLPKQQRQQQPRLKNDLIFNLRLSREFRLLQFVYIVKVPQTEYARQRQISKKKFSKLSSYSSRSLEYAELGFYTLLFVTFCKQRKRNEQRIISHGYTAIVLVAVAVKLCVIKLSKTE